MNPTCCKRLLGAQVNADALSISHCLPTPPNLTFYLYLSPPSPQLQSFWGGPSQFSSCPEKSILGGGLKDLSQEYYSTARHSDKPPVTSSRDGAGQAHALHLGGRLSALTAGKSAIKGKTWITSLLVWAISNLRAPDLWLGFCADSHTHSHRVRRDINNKDSLWW